MKKKILSIIMFVFFLFGLLGCDNQSDIEQPDDQIKEENKEETNEINVIVLCGQSNAEGHTWWIEMQKKNPQLFKKYVNKEDSYLKMKYHCDNGRNKNDEYESVKFGMGYDKNRFGPEIGMNEALEKVELERETYVLKYTVGGTDLHYQWKSYSSGSAGTLYNGMVMYLFEELAALEEAGYVPYVKAICWMQGESDSTEDKKTATYGEYLDNFINDLTTDLEYYVESIDEKIKFIDAGISECPVWKNHETVNNMKVEVQALDSEHRAYIDTISLGLDWRTEPTSGPDTFHYDCLSMVKLGELFIEEIIKFNVLK